MPPTATTSISPILKSQVRSIYKGPSPLPHSPFPQPRTNPPAALLYLGRNYPLGYPYFRSKLRAAFLAQRGLIGEEDVRLALGRAEFVRKGMSCFFCGGREGGGKADCAAAVMLPFFKSV